MHRATDFPSSIAQLGLALLACCATGPGASASECLAGSYANEFAVAQGSNGRYTQYGLTGSNRFDAQDVAFSGIDDDGDFVPWPVKLVGDIDPASASCWVGGHIAGAWDEDGTGVFHPDDGLPVTWEDPFHHSGAITLQIGNLLLEDLAIPNHGDGIRSYGDGNRVVGAYVTDIHDDCVENDDLYNLTIEDSFFDGCYVAFSARTFSASGADGSDKLFEIRNSLVRLEPQPTVYKPEVYGAGPGHGQFFKWDSDPSIALKLSLHDNIFLATQENRHGGGLGVEEVSNLESCSNNVMVWTGQGPFPNAANLPSCFRLSTDITEWNLAVAAWLASHSIPEVLRRQCSDGEDNDGDGLLDYPADPGCSGPSDDDELPACGLGPELALLLPALLGLRRRRLSPSTATTREGDRP